MSIFIGKKRNKSSKVSIRVLKKVGRRNQLLKTIGCISNEEQIKRMIAEGHRWIAQQAGLLSFDFYGHRELAIGVLEMIDQVTVAGIRVIEG